MRLDGKTLGAGFGVLILGLVVGFLVHKCPCPADGNPIGYHLHGLAKIDKGNGIDISHCPDQESRSSCVLTINVAIGKAGANPADTPTPCPNTRNCANFSGSALTESSVDSSATHTPEPVKAIGAFELAPFLPRGSPQIKR